MPVTSDRAQMLLWAGVALALLWLLYVLGPVLALLVALRRVNAAYLSSSFYQSAK